MIVGMPGLGGSLGQCQLCGKDFLAEIMLGADVAVGHISGITANGEECELALHQACKELLEDNPPWEELPPGPIRSVYEAEYTPNGI